MKNIISLLRKSCTKSKPNWAKWNPETPKYPELINEYNKIMENTKKAGTWMKNPDGSYFQGFPEQFIQLRSIWFKKYVEHAGGNYEDILNNPFLYHGTRTKGIKEFHTPQHPDYKKQTRDTPETGIFMTPDKSLADIYASEDIWKETKTGFKWVDCKKVGYTYQLYAPANYANPGLKNPNNVLTTTDGTRVEKLILTGNIDLKDVEYLIKLNFSGIKNSAIGSSSEKVVFNPAIIKSSVGNVGFFDTNYTNIYN